MHEDSRAHVAYHEAGHAVAHFAFDLPFDKVTIIPDDEDGSAGAIHHAPVNDPDWWDVEEDEKNLLIDKHVLNLFAGPLAQERFTGAYDADGSETDRHDAWDYASRRCGSEDEQDAYMNWMHIRARNFVNQPGRWMQIQAVAVALLKRLELNQDEAIEVMRSAVKL